MRNSPTRSAPQSISPPPWGGLHQNLLQPQRETESLIQLSCDVVFGSPAADCRGTGVCKISARSRSSAAPEVRRKCCRSTTGLLFSMEGGNEVSLVLTRALLCTKLYKAHLRHGTLTLHEPCVLPREIAASLGLKIKQLAAGIYPVQQTADFLRIDFRDKA